MFRRKEKFLSIQSLVVVATATLLSLTPFILTGCGDSDSDAPGSVSITMLHTNDTHSQLESFIPFGEPEQGGVARRKTLIDAVRDEVGEDQVLVVDAGDFSQGTIFYNAWEGSADIMALNAMGYEAVTLGNHEFDLGPEKLGRALAGESINVAGTTYLPESLMAPVVSCNLDVNAEPALAGRVEPYLILRKNGADIGILGVTTETVVNISNIGDNVVVNDYVTSVQAGIDDLEAQGVNKIILLSHAGYSVDLQKVKELAGIDIIVSGHDHPLLLDPADYAAGSPLEFLADRVDGDYPTVTEDLEGNPVLIVGAYEWGKILGRLDITFNSNGIITDWQGNSLFVDNSINPDTQLASDVAFYKAPISEFSNVVIGQTDVFLDGNRDPGVRTQEMPLGNLVADVMLDSASTYDTAVAAITNGGGIRASLPQGTDPADVDPPYDVTYGEALTVLPYGNTISTIDVTGSELVAALDNGLTWAYDAAAGTYQSSGAFPQVAGMSLSYCGATVSDIRAGTNPPAGCPAALLAGGVVTSLNVAGNPVDLGATYRIATNNFMAGGGDFYAPLETACDRIGGYCVDTGILMLDAFIEEFSTNSPVVRDIENRIVAE